MTDLSPAARAAQSAARDPKGRFGVQPVAEADVGLLTVSPATTPRFLHTEWPVGFVPSFALDGLDTVESGEVEDDDFSLADLDPLDVVSAERLDAMVGQLRTDGAVFEPLVIRVYPDARAVLVDGHHRYFAARAVGIRWIPAMFHHGVPDPNEEDGWAFPTQRSWW